LQPLCQKAHGLHVDYACASHSCNYLSNTAPRSLNTDFEADPLTKSWGETSPSDCSDELEKHDLRVNFRYAPIKDARVQVGALVGCLFWAVPSGVGDR
ncbi:hypothetical protein, partial [Pseudomonas coronafaciens]|uniref:hypothetical protein n=1 Tax=Pseudomonas coronafaciens TaxID=53409 RepID=UPI001CC1F4EB